VKTKLFLILICVACGTQTLYSQTKKIQQGDTLTAKESLEFIAGDIQSIALSLKNLNKDIVKAYGTLSSSLGLSLTEKQQKLLVSFEILNRAEQRLGNLQKLRIDLIQKQNAVASEISKVNIDLNEERIQRSVALEGTTDAEGLRDKRRQALTRQKSNLKRLLNEINKELISTKKQYDQTIYLVERIRWRLFPAIFKELPKLESEQ